MLCMLQSQNAAAQMIPSTGLLHAYARIGAIEMYRVYRERGNNLRACEAAHHLLYLYLQPESSADDEDIATAKQWIFRTCM